MGSVSIRFQFPRQQPFTTDIQTVFSEGQGFVLVYSIASRATFDRLEVFRQNMVRVKRTPPVFVLVGNKSDKTYEREVSREEGAALARHWGCEFLETSAKTRANVEKLFTDLIRTLRHQKEYREDGLPAGGHPQTGGMHPAPKKKSHPKCVIV